MYKKKIINELIYEDKLIKNITMETCCEVLLLI